MIYVYDIILNWTDEDKIYEFFEWELNDDLEHIKKIPLFKIDSNTFDDILNYEVKTNDVFLNKIKNLTEIYTSEKIDVIPYSTLVTDGTRAVAVEFDNNGVLTYRSRLLLDEEQDILILSNKLLEYNLFLEKIKQRNWNPFITRLDEEIKKVLTKEITNSYKKGCFDKIKYLYFECFDKEQDDVDIAYQKLLASLEKEVNYHHNKLYEVVKLSYQNKN